MAGRAKTSAPRSESGESATVYDFAIGRKDLLMPVEKYKTGRKKPQPKSLKKGVSRFGLGWDALEQLGRRGQLVGAAELEYQRGRRKAEERNDPS